MASGEPSGPTLRVDRRHDREHERPAELERRVHEPAGEPLLLRRDAGRGGDVERPEGEREAEAREQERRQQRERVARVEADREEQDVRRRRSTPCPRRSAASRRSARSAARSAARATATSAPAGEDREPGLERRPAAQLLHVERRDELEPDPAAEQRHRGEVRAHERRPSAGCRAGSAAPPRAARARTNAARITATPASEPSVRSEAQPTVGASTRVKTSSSIAAVSVTAPAMSKRRGDAAAGRCAARAAAPAISATSATGAGRKNTQPPADLGQQAAEDEAEREPGRARSPCRSTAPCCAPGLRRRSW